MKLNREQKLTIVARAVHEAVRAYQAALGEKEAPRWDDAGWMQGATREAVEFALSDPTPGAQHQAWCAAKLRDGWRYGERRDDDKKLHPSLRPFDQLTEAERMKDAIIIAVVQAVAPILGLEGGHG